MCGRSAYWLLGLALLIAVPARAGALIEQRPLGGSAIADVSDGGDEDSSFLSSFSPRRNGVVRVVGALVLVIGLIVVLRVVLRASAPTLGIGGRPGGVLQVLARYPIGKGQQLLVLSFAGRIVLLHQAGTNVRSLCEITDPEDIDSVHERLDKRPEWPAAENDETVVDLTRRSGRSA